MQSFPKNVLDELQRHLVAERNKTTQRIGELTAQDPFMDPDRVNDNAASDSEANEESSHDRFAALVSEEKARLAAIEEALERITHGTYGYCTNCGNMIDTDRLAILPTATLCLTCESSKRRPSVR